MLLRKFSQTFKVSLALLFAVFSSGIVNVLPLASQTAYASHTCSTTPAFTEESGGWVKYEPVDDVTFDVPQKTGFTVTQICYKSAEQHPLQYPTVSPTITSTVMNRNDEIQEISHVAVYYTKNQTSVPVPVNLETVDPCNAVDVTNNVAWKDELPLDTATIDWSESIDGATRTAALIGTNIKWDDDTTAPKVFNLPSDAGIACEVSTTSVPVPVNLETVDPCNAVDVTNNVAWKDELPLDTATIDWSESIDGATRTAALIGTNIKWDDDTTAPKVFNLPSDAGIACEVEETDMCRNVPGIQSSADLAAYAPYVFQRGNGNCVVTICHRTNAAENPYNKITVSLRAVDGEGRNDHSRHTGPIFDPATMTNGDDWGDIIPPNFYDTEGDNWTAQGQAVYANGDCEVPVLTADIEATVICVANGVRVTLTNSGGADGTATVNGEEYDVLANDTTEVPLGFDLGTPFKTAVKVMVGESTLIDRTVSCGNLLGTTDVCPNIEGTQTVVPAGLIRNTTTGECFTPGGRGAFTPAQVLGAATALPETLPSTGGADSPLAIIIASILAYGAAYFLQGRRLLGRKEALSA